MLRARKPCVPPDDELPATYANRYVITATCSCGHSREILVRPIQKTPGKSARLGRVRDSLRCHRCQERRPRICK